MSPDKLVRMANQIAGFFQAYPADEACAAVREHIIAFWTPSMRRALLDYAESSGAGLDPLVVMAIQSGLRSRTACIGETGTRRRDNGNAASRGPAAG